MTTGSKGPEGRPSPRQLYELVVLAFWPRCLENRAVGIAHLQTCFSSDAGNPTSLDDLQTRQLHKQAMRVSASSPWPSFDRFRAQTDAERELFKKLVELADLASPVPRLGVEDLVEIVFLSRNKPKIRMALTSVLVMASSQIVEYRQLERQLHTRGYSSYEERRKIEEGMDATRVSIADIGPELGELVEDAIGPLKPYPSTH